MSHSAGAQHIIAGRPYKTREDLGQVKGLGETKLGGLKGLLAFKDKAVEKTVTEKAKAETASTKETLALGEKLDLNTATAGRLDDLFGVGPVKSQAIVDYRKANGKFSG